jgi:repressor LexA
MTDRQRQVLMAIDSLTRKHGYPPTVREVGTAVGIKSSSTAVQHLLKVQNAGLVEWEQGKSRTIRLTEAGRREIE